MRRNPASIREGIRMAKTDDTMEPSKESMVQSFGREYGKASAYALGTAAVFFVIWLVLVLLLMKCS